MFAPNSKVSDVASSIYRRVGSPEEAVTELVVMAHKDETLAAALLEGALEERAARVIKFIAAERRLRIAGAGHKTDGYEKLQSEDVTTEAVKVGANLQTLFYTYRLPNGGPMLRDATREQIMTAVVYLREQASEMTRLAKWLDLIAKDLRPGETPKRKISVDRTKELAVMSSL